MEKNIFLKKLTAFIVITLFIAASFIPSISGNTTEFDKKQSIKSQKHAEDQEDVLVTCYTFGMPGDRSQEFEMTYKEITELFDTITEYSKENMYDPQSQKTQQLLQDIFTIAEERNLLPADITPETFQRQINYFTKKQNTKIAPSPILQKRASAFFCNFATTGTGSQFPIIIFPRLIPIIQLPIPRLFLRWTATNGITSCGGLLSGKGYIAYGPQKGTALGFWGIGFSVFLPPIMQYGFIGYALYATTEAETIELWPPNNPPTITPINPYNGEINVPVSLSELEFQISDYDGDLMSYTVTTTPDIGSGSGNLKPDGVYSVPISDLAYDKIYRWTVEVDDGKDTIQEEFTFFPEDKPPFDPFNEGWQYRKQIVIDHAKVHSELNDFPALVSITDLDLRDKAQDDGDDILFMDGDGVATKLYHEIEKYDESSGELIAWVNIPSLSSTEDTALYIYYGNPSCSNQQFPEKVWDSTFEAVWHMNDLTPTMIEDSTFNNNNGVKVDGANQPLEVEAKIGNGQDFEVSNTENIIVYDGVYECAADEDITLEFWIKMETVQGSAMSCDNDDYSYYKIHNDADGHFRVIFFSMHPYTIVDPTSTTSGQVDIWYYIVGKLDRNAGYGYIFLNGTEEGIFSTGELGGLDGLHHFRIGSSYHSVPATYTDGIIDEVRISNVARSSAWINTSFQNQNDPSSFMSIGPEEPAP